MHLCVHIVAHLCVQLCVCLILCVQVAVQGESPRAPAHRGGLPGSVCGHPPIPLPAGACLRGSPSPCTHPPYPPWPPIPRPPVHPGEYSTCGVAFLSGGCLGGARCEKGFLSKGRSSEIGGPGTSVSGKRILEELDTGPRIARWCPWTKFEVFFFRGHRCVGFLG